MTPQDFVKKWRGITSSTERQVYQQHFLDLCDLVGHLKPADLDPDNKFFTFEAGATKQAGGNGWADVWYRGHFAIEYKKPDAPLEKAYTQLLQYRESLENPPLLITSNIQTLTIHTNFTNSVKQVVTISLDDLLTPIGLQRVRNIFYNPEAFRPEKTAQQVTEEAAARFAQLAEHLRKWGNNPHDIAHYSIRLLFCLFAEDIDLLPREVFTQMVDKGRRDPKAFNRQVQQLFHAMAEGDTFGPYAIPYFNGGLFDGADTLELDSDGISILHAVTQLDWSAIEPSILGTLFTRSLDPTKRAQLGAQYTSRADILLIVEPVLMAPLRREWEQIQQRAQEMAQKRDTASTRAVSTRVQNELRNLIMDFVDKIRDLRVLDPACGSGNFLYICLRLLLDLEKEVSSFCGEVGLQPFFPEVNPSQLYGIEVNDYAHELAQATVWIGYLQWLHENGYGFPGEPILKPLDNIKHMDAILAFDENGNPVEPEWPEVDVIVGNPPFLGIQRLRKELTDKYVDDLFKVYQDRVPSSADLVCYWFERARIQIEVGKASRTGFIATQSIRSQRNRTVLERIKKSGNIFMAWSDRPWILDGAAVRVSMVGFDDNSELNFMLDGEAVQSINANLTSAVDFTRSGRLKENLGLGFEGIKKNGPFEIDETEAHKLLNSTNVDSRRANSDVVKRWMNADELMHRGQPMWLIDFGINTPINVAAEYSQPFEYARNVVYPARQQSSNKNLREYWWLFERPRPAMRKAIARLRRFIATPRVAKHRVFVWLDATAVVPDGRLNVFAMQDDYSFGILQSQVHELWTLKHVARHGVGNDPTYNNRTCFETFPFPWSPGTEPNDAPQVQAIAQAAKELVEQRDAWLNPPGLTEKELQKRTLTNLYNQRPDWLDAAHKKLDAAVFDAYGWPHDLTDEEILAQLLALNLERARLGGAAAPSPAEDTPADDSD